MQEKTVFGVKYENKEDSITETMKKTEKMGTDISCTYPSVVTD